MDDEKTEENPKEEKKEGTEEGAGAGNKYETTPVIERAREEREKLEAANKKHEELLNRQEEIMAKQALGGRAEAGSTPEKPKEISEVEYAEKALSGEYNNEK